MKLKVFALFGLIAVLAFAACSAEDFSKHSAAIRQAQRLQENIQRLTRSAATGQASVYRPARAFSSEFSHKRDLHSHVRHFLRSHDFFGLRDVQDLRFVETRRDVHFGERSVAVFHQNIDGIPVFGATMRFHLDENMQITQANGNIVPDAHLVEELQNLDSLKISANEAREIAIANVREAKAPELESKWEATDPELFIYRDGLFAGVPGESFLTWVCTVTNPERAMIKEQVFVQVSSGEVITTISQIHNALYREAWEGFYAYAYYYYVLPFWAEGDIFPTSEADANTNLEVTVSVYDAFKNMFNYPSYDGNDAKMINIFNYIDHPNDPQCPNAWWDGEKFTSCPGVSGPDVVGHEWGHAYVEKSAGLIYKSQSGALNEGMADIIGETIQQLFGNDPGPRDQNCGSGDRWIIGDEISDSIFGTHGIRDMYNPHCFDQPRKVTDGDYVVCRASDDHGGVHTNSGISNQWYSLLADGGVRGGVTVTGIGIVKAFHITMRALLLYMTSANTFSELADHVDQSCQDLIGININDPRDGSVFGKITAADCTQVSNADLAVGLRDSYCSVAPLAPPIVDPYNHFPRVGDVGPPPYTTVYFVTKAALTPGGFNPTCRFQDLAGNQIAADAPAVFIPLEVVYLFGCVTPQSDTVGDQIKIFLSVDGTRFSAYQGTFTYISSVSFSGISPDTGDTAGLQWVTVTGANFEEFKGCTPFYDTDPHGDPIDCLTCSWGNINKEYQTGAKYIDSTHIQCRVPPYDNLVDRSVMPYLELQISKNNQVFIGYNPSIDYTFYFPFFAANGLTTDHGSRFPVNTPVTILVTCDPLSDGMSIELDWDGDDVRDARGTCNGANAVSFAHTYTQRANPCLKACITDNIGQQTCDFSRFSCSGKKRAVNGNALQLSVTAVNAGDPHFVGFGDGESFEFAGEAGRAYNYVSAPFLQMNGEVDTGYASDLGHLMPSVTRSVAAMWDHDSHVQLGISRKGQITGELVLAGRKVAVPDVPAESQEGSVMLHWVPHANETRAVLGLYPHRVLHQVSLVHKNFQLDVYAVELQIRSLKYYFVDTEMSLSKDVAGQCLDGVWGRTTCAPSKSSFDPIEYDIGTRADLTRTDFPLHNLYV